MHFSHNPRIEKYFWLPVPRVPWNTEYFWLSICRCSAYPRVLSISGCRYPGTRGVLGIFCCLRLGFSDYFWLTLSSVTFKYRVFLAVHTLGTLEFWVFFADDALVDRWLLSIFGCRSNDTPEFGVFLAMDRCMSWNPEYFWLSISWLPLHTECYALSTHWVPWNTECFLLSLPWVQWSTRYSTNTLKIQTIPDMYTCPVLTTFDVVVHESNSEWNGEVLPSFVLKWLPFDDCHVRLSLFGARFRRGWSCKNNTGPDIRRVR